MELKEVGVDHPKVSNEDMRKRIVRFEAVKKHGIPLMFIDSILPGHQRMNYAVVGDTASENPDYAGDVILPQPHRFQIGMVKAPHGNGPAYHTHDYIELFIPLTGNWRFYWGNDPDPDKVEGEDVIGPWDMISLPPGLWRGLENISGEDAWLLAVLEPHMVFDGKDPIWSPTVERQAAEYGFYADTQGKMVKPENYEELKRQTIERLDGQVRA
jgi:quercetin dioxygenase-like cupin family protein